MAPSAFVILVPAPTVVRVETFPLIIGIVVALLGIGILFDAWTPDASTVSTERRRRPRIERHRNGEALIGFGVLALAAAFIGRDSWRYSVLVVIIGAVFLLVGAVLNRGYVRELFVNRGPLRRREPGEGVAAPPLITAEREKPLSSVDEATPTPDATLGEGGWDGMERRKTPRDNDKRKPRGRSAEDSPRR
jgi:hypothetical protein